MEFSSKLLENAVDQIAQLPGIGKRTALRLALHLLRQPKGQTQQLSQSLRQLREDIKYCVKCHNISDTDVCHICLNPERNASIICVVEDLRDVMAIENTAQFKGHYHVLGGKISPMEGIGPGQLHIQSLVDKVKSGAVKEVIFALSNTMDADTTNFFIYRQLEGLPVLISTLSRGISVGDELEYTDEVTLGRSIAYRIPFEQSINNK